MVTRSISLVRESELSQEGAEVPAPSVVSRAADCSLSSRLRAVLPVGARLCRGNTGGRRVGETANGSAEPSGVFNFL